MKESQIKKENLKDKIIDIEKENLKDKIIDILEIEKKERIEGGVCKHFDLGIIDSSIIVPGIGKIIKMFEYKKRELIIQYKKKLKKELGDEYQKLTFDIRMKKPKFGATGSQQRFSVDFIVYGPDFPQLIRKIGRNKNIKIIE